MPSEFLLKIAAQADARNSVRWAERDEILESSKTFRKTLIASEGATKTQAVRLYADVCLEAIQLINNVETELRSLERLRVELIAIAIGEELWQTERVESNPELVRTLGGIARTLQTVRELKGEAKER